MNSPRFFGIGLPKTGTMSLNRALVALGLNSTHYPIKDVIPALQEGRYEVMRSHEAFANCGEWHFAALKRVYPQARFIHTWRPFENWIVSVRKHFAAYPPAVPKTAQYANRLEVFGTAVFDPDVMETIYFAHQYAVERAFAGSDKILKLDVTEPDAWHRLCSFVGKNMPDQAFPHENRAQEPFRRTWKIFGK